MAITAQVNLSFTSYPAGFNPPPLATLTVANSGAAAVAIIGTKFSATVAGASAPSFTSIATPVLPTGPGQNLTVPASGSLSLGPFPIVLPSAANNNPNASIPPAAAPQNPQPSQPIPFSVTIGCDVLTSDGAVTSAGTAFLILTGTSTPPQGNYGGFLQFYIANNFINGVVTGTV
jgi:hypothetical protein